MVKFLTRMLIDGLNEFIKHAEPAVEQSVIADFTKVIAHLNQHLRNEINPKGE
jgi:hypothetical protein